MTTGPAPPSGRVVLAVGRLVLAVGAVFVVVALVVRPGARQEVAGIGLATVMGGMMIVLLGNYLRHAATRDTETPPGPAPGPDGAAGTRPGGGTVQPSSVPTTDTNDTISPG